MFSNRLNVIGIVAASAWQSEVVTTLKAGESVEIAGYTVAFEGLEKVMGPNYQTDEGHFTVTAPGGGTRKPVPERRIYAASGTPTTEAAIETYGFSQLYLQLGEPAEGYAQVVRLWYKPFVTLIWLGALLMAGAGLLSLTYRRLRVGAPRPAQKPVAAE